MLRIAENAHTVSASPESVSVDLVSYDSSGLEIDRVSRVELQRLDADGDPSYITYHNDLYKPIVFVDTTLDKNAYPNVIIIQAQQDGSAVIVPATN